MKTETKVATSELLYFRGNHGLIFNFIHDAGLFLSSSLPSHVIKTDFEQFMVLKQLSKMFATVNYFHIDAQKKIHFNGIHYGTKKLSTAEFFEFFSSQKK